MQKFSDMYNVSIIRLHGADRYAKGLIEAMSSFDVKSILPRDVVAVEKSLEP